MRPAISIVMAAYNEELSVGSAIQSIIDQTFKRWELIIIDDGSIDGTVEVIHTFTEKDSRIISLKNKSNIGLPASLNKGIAVSQGAYIARADADDLNLPARLEKQFKFMQDNPEIDVLGTGAFLLDESRQRVNTVCLPETHEQLKETGFLKTYFFHSSVIIRKSFFEKAGRYDITYSRAQDKELWLRGLRNGCRYANLQEPLIEYYTGGYIRSWKSVKYRVVSSFRMVQEYKVKNGYFLTILSLLLELSVKFGLRKPRSLQ